MSGLRTDVDPNGLLEYSVVFTDRSLNHMSNAFQEVMHDLSAMLKGVYNARSVIIVPGSGTFGMEAVARQFATQRHCLVVRNGWFSYRWTQIFEMGNIPASETVLKARRIEDHYQAPFSPAPIEEVVATIREQQPEVVFAPHVETASGIMLPDDYLREMAEAVHAAGGLFVLDCIASGSMWVDMDSCGVDVLLSAPQKGWSSSPGCALVMLSPQARERIEATTSTSYACDLLKWLQIMETYEAGSHAYHATMPTDGLRRLRDAMQEARNHGLERLRHKQADLGTRVRALLRSNGFNSVAAPGFEAPGVVVAYTDDEGISSGTKFAKAGLQIAAGVPLRCDEPERFRTFRLGLFGFDKLNDPDRIIAQLKRALEQLG